MKRNRTYQLFGWLSVLTLMLTTACASVDDLELSQVKDKQTVTFTIQPQSQSGGMRDATDTYKSTIGQGSKIDVLVYAVYEQQNDGTYKITSNEALAKGSYNSSDFQAGTGQTVIKCEKSDYPVTITLELDAKTTYKVAFWAQSSQCKAYTTTNLEKVIVNYEDAINNDETRDAFCAVSDPLKGDGKNHSITLRRPFAQINVGTTGWDYEGAAILRPSAVGYTKSQIKLKGVAKYYNVLEGKTLTKEDLADEPVGTDDDDNNDPSLTTVTFTSATIPAFTDIIDTDAWNSKVNKYERFPNEESLVVDLDETGGIKPYKTWEEYKNATPKLSLQNKDTEVFKYLSMCYVLVPEASTNKIDRINSGSVLTEIEFQTWGEKVKSDADDIEEGDDENKDKGVTKTFTINQIPVQKNWRTNILSDGFYVSNIEFTIDIVPVYCGDYNYVDDEWYNVHFDETDPNNWKLKDDEDGNGSPNDEFDPDEGDYYGKGSNE